MKKASMIVLIGFITIFTLSSCGSTEGSTSTADTGTIENETEEENGEISSEELKEDVIDNNSVAEVEDKTEYDEYPYYPWVEPLPEGLEATVQKFDDFTLLIHYKNHTGNDIALYTEGAVFDEEGNEINSFGGIQEYIKDGADCIAEFVSLDYFEYNLLYCEIQDVGARTKEINESLSIESSVNSDGSVHLELRTTAKEGVSVDGYVVFTNNDTIVDYMSFGYGFSDEFIDDTEIPEHEYTDYFISYSATN